LYHEDYYNSVRKPNLSNYRKVRKVPGVSYSIHACNFCGVFQKWESRFEVVHSYSLLRKVLGARWATNGHREELSVTAKPVRKLNGFSMNILAKKALVILGAVPMLCIGTESKDIHGGL
jgi:hypothetical protein